MNPLRNIVANGTRLLNQPHVKEGVKLVAGRLSFAFGLVEVYDLYQIFQGGQKISTENLSGYPRWVQVANKVIIVFAKISLILSGATSKPGVFLISRIAEKLFATAFLERTFGPNTIYALNPTHPRHIVSIAAAALALPSVIQSTFKLCLWVFKPAIKTPKKKNISWLTDTKLRLITFFNTVTSRPVLHIGNQLAAAWVRA